VVKYDAPTEAMTTVPASPTDWSLEVVIGYVTYTPSTDPEAERAESMTTVPAAPVDWSLTKVIDYITYTRWTPEAITTGVGSLSDWTLT